MRGLRGRRNRIRVTFTVLVIASAVGGCGSSKAGTSNPTTTTSTSAPADFRALEARLVTVVPSGFVRQPDRIGDTGPSDLAKAIRDDGAPDAESALRSEGLVSGYQALWEGPQQAEIIVFLYQFESEAGAARAFVRDVVLLKSEAPKSARSFVVPGIPTAIVAATEGTGPDGTAAAVVLFTSGKYSAQVICNGPARAGLQERVIPLARAQYQRLR